MTTFHLKIIAYTTKGWQKWANEVLNTFATIDIKSKISSTFQSVNKEHETSCQFFFQVWEHVSSFGFLFDKTAEKCQWIAFLGITVMDDR